MVLTDKEIRDLSQKGSLIEPFCENYLQSESYDLHIGETFYTLKKNNGIIDLDSEDDLNNMYEEKNFGIGGCVLSPKEFILVSLSERITLPPDITARLMPRTRFTRAGIQVSSQHCNSTYSGVLKVGLCNLQERPIRIYGGMGICQIVFEQLSQIPSEVKMYKNKENASYQDESDFIGPQIDPEFKKKVKEIVDYFKGDKPDV